MIIGRQRRVEIAACIFELAAQRELVLVVDVTIKRGIVKEAAMLAFRRRQAEPQRVLNDRAGDHAARLDRVVLAQHHFTAAGKIRQAGLFGDDVHKTAGRVHAEQCPLRPAQHLNPLNIEEVLRGGHASARHEHAIDENAERRLPPRIALNRRHAAQVHGRCPRIAQRQRLEAGCHPLQIVKTRNLGFHQAIATHNRHGDRHIDDVFRPLLCRDNHLLDRTAALRQRRRKAHGPQKCSAQKSGLHGMPMNAHTSPLDFVARKTSPAVPRQVCCGI